MTKLYYDDPLAAAYMAREFGVEYKSNYTKDWLSAQSYTSRGNFDWLYVEYHIHPDSLDIFTPKEGDLVDWDVVNGYSYNAEREKESAFMGGYSKYPVGPNRSDAVIGEVVYKIIQRDGKQFFMPKD